MTLKIFQKAILQNVGEQLLLKVAYYNVFMINELNLLWVPYFIAFGIYFLFVTKFSWNEQTDIYFNAECVLLGRNFDFLGGYCSLPNG